MARRSLPTPRDGRGGRHTRPPATSADTDATPEPGSASAATPPAGPGPLRDDDPQHVGGFRLLSRLSADAWGTFYLGESAAGATVRVRVPPPDWRADSANRAAIARMMVAARRAAGVPGAARLVAADLQAGPPYLAFEAPPGSTVRMTVEAGGPLGPWALERLAVQVLRTLEALHALDVEHGHLDPDAVLTTAEGVVLLDVGLGRPLEGGPGGQSRFAAPEQGHGTPGPAADLHGWAVTMAYAASGRAPAATMFSDATGGTSIDRTDLPELTSPLRDVVRDCLHPEPARRPTARQALARLGAATPPSSGIGGLTRRPGPQPQPRPGPADGTTGPDDATGEPADAPAAGTPQSPPVRRAVRAWAARIRAAGGRWAERWAWPPSRRDLSVAGAVMLVVSVLLGTLVALTSSDPAEVEATGEPRRNDLLRPGSPSECLDERPAGSLSAVRWDPASGCYGFTDTGEGFGRDGIAMDLQTRLLAENQPAGADTLTVLWFGTLSCPGYRDDGTCADGRVLETERSELQGLRLAQRQARTRGEKLRVVIADVGPGMTHAQEVATLVAQRRPAFGRAVAVGGGESRTETRQAIQILLTAGIPFVAPSLSADLSAPGRPFLDQPGYLQLSAPNRDQAAAVVEFVARYTPAPASRQVIVFHAPDAGDEFTASLTADVLQAAGAHPRTSAVPPVVIDDVARLPATICRSATSATGPDVGAPALFYADRWTAFPTFLRALATRCGTAGPAMLVAGNSVARFMASDEARSGVDAPWPLAYVRRGRHCSEIEAAAADPAAREAADLLVALRAELGACAGGPTGRAEQIGERVSLVWDAVALARLALGTDDSGPSGAVTGQLRDVDLLTVNGRFAVRDARVTRYADLGQLICTLTIDRTDLSARSVNNCDTAFAPTPRARA